MALSKLQVQLGMVAVLLTGLAATQDGRTGHGHRVTRQRPPRLQRHDGSL